MDETKPVVVCGDLNKAHTEMDLANSELKKDAADFANEETKDMAILIDFGPSDAVRQLNPHKTGVYTFWKVK